MRAAHAEHPLLLLAMQTSTQKRCRDAACTEVMFPESWHACMAGAVPIPGAKSVAQVKEHLGALDFYLDENESAVIDERLDAF